VDSSGNVFLSYWVDKTLASMYPVTPTVPGPNILTLTATDATKVETLATQNADGSVVVMVANHSIASATDNNGSGAPQTVVVDLSGLGSFSSASTLTIDSGTSVANGPSTVDVTPEARMTLNLNGYGTTWLVLKP
jgi:hypothetical protein